MDKEELLKDILDNPAKYYNHNQLQLLSTKIKKETGRGNMRRFLKKVVEYDKDREYVFTDIN